MAIMKLVQYVYEIRADADHDRNLDRLLARAGGLGLHCTRSVIGTGLASGTALLYEGVMAEQGEKFSAGIDLTNRCLEELRNSFFVFDQK